MIYIPTRSELLSADKIIKKLDLRAGMTAVDLGCGTSGHFVFPTAKEVGEEGKVYAVDILKSALSSVDSKAKLQGFGNIETIWADIEVLKGTGIADSSCDAVYLINVHAKPGMLAEALRILKPNAKLLIIDWKMGAISMGPSAESRISQNEAKARIKKLPLDLGEEFEAGSHHWGLICKKRS